MRKLYLSAAFILLLGIGANAQTKRYVKPGGTGDGSTWAAAAGNLQTMINASAVNDEVWVAAGTYLPTEKIDASGGVRDVSFILKAGVKIYGGLAEGAIDLIGRDFVVNSSILSGDLGASGKAYHVVVSKGSSNNAVLDGFTIQDGLGDANASLMGIAKNQGAAINISNEETSVLFKNLMIRNNVTSATNNGGAGVYLKLNNASNCTFENVVFDTNESVSASGGGIYFTNTTGNPILTILNSKMLTNKGTGGAAVYILGNANNVPQLRIFNSIFSENYATNTSTTAGAVYCGTNTNTVIVNATFYKNYSVNGGVSFNNSSGVSLSIYNTLFNANRKGISESTLPVDIRYIAGATLDLRSNLFQVTPIEGTSPAFKNTVDPNPTNLFLSTTTTDVNFLKLVEGAATEKGDNQYIATYTISSDLAGETRIKHTNVDLGAYEYQGTLPVTLISFSAKKSNTNVQLQWKLASEFSNEKFVVEHSPDLVNFKKLTEVLSKGDTQNELVYNFTDHTPIAGNNYYRLSQVDRDGTSKVLGVEVVKFDFSKVDVTIYPNPAQDFIKLKANNFEGSVNIKLVSLLGQTLMSKRFNSVNEVLLDVRNINAGNYILIVKNHKDSLTDRLTIVK